MSTTEIKPQPGPQVQFLSSSADIVIYGGAAGGGKTFGLLTEPLRHINNPDFDAVIFRRTSPQLKNPGSLYPESTKLYPLLGGKATQPDSGFTWTFPSGATVRLTHLQHDKNVQDWQGAQIPLIAFDELTHFTEDQFWYMLSRNRSLCGVRPYIRATTNPAPGWVAKLIDWWIDNDGYAIPERGGVIRWFVRYGGDLHWSNDPHELERKFPGTIAKSLTFIPARLQDNKILMKKNPEYLASLLALPLVDRERLLGGDGGKKGGNWKITPSGGKVFNRAWFPIIHRSDVPKGGVMCRFWDIAATEQELKGDDPDFTAGVLMLAVGGNYYILDVINERLEPGPTDRLIRKTAERDAKRAARAGAKYMVRWEKQPAAAGKRDNRNIAKLLDGFDARGVPPQGDKITRAKPLSSQVEVGFVLVCDEEWTESYLQHMHHQPDWDHDDMMDGSSGAYNELVKEPMTSDSVDFYAKPDSDQDGDEGPELRSERDVSDMLDEYEKRQGNA